MQIRELERRDLTPEDYELLLSLLEEPAQERSPQSAMSAADFARLPAAAPGGGWVGDTCAVCLGEMAQEEDVKQLVGCRHVFHACCLERWVTGRRAVCPLDNLPLKLESDELSSNAALQASEPPSSR